MIDVRIADFMLIVFGMLIGGGIAAYCALHVMDAYMGRRHRSLREVLASWRRRFRR
jgi:hypothetical protein